jgi:hypothetical protein
MLEKKANDFQPAPESGLHQRRPSTSVDIVEIATLVVKELDHLIMAFDCGQGDAVDTVLISPVDERIILVPP